MAEAWASGYWHGTSHTGPLNEAAVNAKNPHRNGNSSEGKESTPDKKKVLMNQVTKWPATVTDLVNLAVERGMKPSELWGQLEQDLGPATAGVTK